MPRRYLIAVKPFPKLKPGSWYSVRVFQVEPAGTATLRVTLEHVNDDQAGRTAVVSLSLPVRPEGLTAQFFRAAGVDVAIGTKIDPKGVDGATVRVRFAPPLGDGEWQPMEFAVQQHGGEDGP